MFTPHNLKVTAAIFCRDLIEQDEAYDLLGEFREVVTNEPPVFLPAFYIYVIITDEVGWEPERLDIRLMDSERMLDSGPTLSSGRRRLSLSAG